QAEELLRGLIQKDEYKSGKYLPNEVELSEQLKISRNTLRQALNKLVFEGLLIRKKGVGTRVAEKKVFSEANKWLSFSQEMNILGIKVCNFEFHLSWQTASKNESAFFNIENAEPIFTLERLRGKENFPFVYFISKFNPAIPFSGSENFNRPLYEILENDYNIIVRTSKEEISAMGADSFIASKLRINEGEPILVRKRHVYDINNKPIEYNIGYYRAESFTYTIECQRNT
ncbi:MAG: GntR family transcriptional regulator, partial [Prevotellaceae bacterium]|nr:GntR family transcriptional regulator [Prevotellaceae bacterium]